VLASSIVEAENSLLTNAFTSSGGTIVLPPQGTKRKALSCPTCGGTDHQRCSSKKCPQYKPRIKSRKGKKPTAQDQDVSLDDKPERKTTCTVNIGFNTLLVAQQLRDVIIDAVARCTDIYSEASRFLNGYVIWRLEQGQNIPDLRYSAGYMRQFFQAVLCTSNNAYVRKSVADASINQYALLYSAHRPATLAWNDTSFISQLVSSMANLYAANCQNHVVTNMERWVSRLVKYKLEKHLEFLLNGDEREALRKYIMAKLLDPNSTTIQFPGSVMNRFTADDESKTLVIAGVEHILEKVGRKIEFKALDEESLKSEWWTYIPGMWRILKTFANNNRRDAEERRHTMRKGRGLRLFSLVPISSLRQKHILIETTALYYLFRAANYPNLPSLEEFKDEQSDWWRRAFNIDLVTTERREFGSSITTDGIQACVHLQKPRVQSQLNDWGYRYDARGIYVPLNIQDGTRIVGLDPGRGSLYAAVSGETPGDVLECSNGRWQEISGTRYSTKKNKTWMKNDPLLRTWITLMPTPCCYTSATYNQHLLHFLGMRDLLLGFYRDIKWRRLRWKTRIKRQKAYDTICNELTGGSADTVIAYGGGRFHHASRGHAPTPNKHLFEELKRRCRPRLTPEYRTSVVCSICQHELTQSRIWQVKNCENCLTIWNRDVNAARNIRLCFMFKNDNNGDRPEPFQYIQHP
jgi:hypothetical protein